MGSAARTLRADAQRNYDAILAAARTTFAESGADAPMEDVARAAGVGQGTLYRRFPTREHLFAAILQGRVDELDAAAQRLLDAPDAWLALREWLELYDRCATEYPGMSARVGTALTQDASAVGTMCGPMKASFARLFQRAQAEVPLRRDLTPTLLLSMVSALPKDPGSGRTLPPCLTVVMDGLRAPAGRREHRRPPARLHSGAGLRLLRLAVRPCGRGTRGMDRWLRDNGPSGGLQTLCLSGNDSNGTGDWCALVPLNGKKHCYACNKIKLLEKGFGTDRTARDGHARAARCATPQPEQ